MTMSDGGAVIVNPEGTDVPRRRRTPHGREAIRRLDFGTDGSAETFSGTLRATSCWFAPESGCGVSRAKRCGRSGPTAASSASPRRGLL